MSTCIKNSFSGHSGIYLGGEKKNAFRQFV